MTMTQACESHVGRFARSVESGWLGKVVAIDRRDPECAMLKMQGVNELCRMVAGGSHEQWLDEDDTQWFCVDDVKFL
jgi:hypothetical protein